MKQINTKYRIYCLGLILALAPILNSCSEQNKEQQEKISKVWLIGDSTVANYALESNYQGRRYPITVWGQVFQQFMTKDSLRQISQLVDADSLIVDDRAKGGRSTRTFFQEGRWRAAYNEMQPGDLVLIQFGHNDAAVNKPERYVNEEGYREFLRLFVQQTREKEATPILITPVARNYPWENNHLENVHGNYPGAMKEVASEMDVFLIDLNQLSMNSFSEKGREFVSKYYFMNLPAGIYEAYPEGQDDNTHFQPAGATEVARLVFEGMKNIGKN